MGKFKKSIKTLFQDLRSYKWATSQIEKQSKLTPMTLITIFTQQLSLKSDPHFSVSKKNTKNAPMKTADQTIIIILIILCTYTVPFLTFTSCFKFSIPCKMVKVKNKHALLSFCCQPLENAFVFLISFARLQNVWRMLDCTRTVEHSVLSMLSFSTSVQAISEFTSASISNRG